ncbi:MAG: 50S ribosomal protein L6 [Ignavibacteria bacterium]|nr:50S ribosomal protein L6 [Ignavibacteria bacterium]
MSRIGFKPVTFDSKIKITGKDDSIEVTGPLGTLSMKVHERIKYEIKDNQVTFSRINEWKSTKALHGLHRALLQNLIVGVTEGYTKRLEIVGIGYKAEMKNNYLLLHLGYSHSIAFLPPPEVKVEVPAPNQIVVSGIDKQLVGLVAAKIRSFRKPEPYKGKGIKYENEVIRRKQGKTQTK